jgi:hypothetical protein
MTACFSPSVRACSITPPTKYLSDFHENFYGNYFKKFSIKCEFYKIGSVTPHFAYGRKFVSAHTVQIYRPVRVRLAARDLHIMQRES